MMEQSFAVSTPSAPIKEHSNVPTFDFSFKSSQMIFLLLTSSSLNNSIALKFGENSKPDWDCPSALIQLWKPSKTNSG